MSKDLRREDPPLIPVERALLERGVVALERIAELLELVRRDREFGARGKGARS